MIWFDEREEPADNRDQAGAELAMSMGELLETCMMTIQSRM